MVRLLRPTSGSVHLLDKPLDHSPDYTARHVSYMPQSGEALNHLQVDEILYFTAHLRGYSRAFLLATVWAFFLISLPSALVTLLVGSAILVVPLNIHILIIVVLPVMSVSLCGLGVLISLLSRSIHEAGMMMNLVNFLLVGPVLIPRDLLPDWLGIATLLSPATYAADALRQVALDAPPLLPLPLDLAVLTATGAGLLWLAIRWIDWRR